MVMVAAGRDEGGLACRTAASSVEAQHAAVEAERAVEVGDLEMDVADRVPGWIGPSPASR